MKLKNFLSSRPKTEILALVGLFFVAITPLIFYRPLFQYYTSPKAFFLFAIGELILVTFVWLMYYQPSIRPRFTLVGITLSLFVGTQVLSALVGIDLLNSLWSQPSRMTGVFLLIHLLGLFFAFSTLLRSWNIWRNFLAVNVLVGLIVSFLYWFPIFQALTLESNGGSTLGNSSLFGTYLLFIIGFSCVLALDTQARFSVRTHGAVCAIIFLITLFSTDAHATQISLIGALILALALTLVRLGKHPWMRRLGWSLVGLLVSGIIGLSILVFISGSSIQERFLDIGGPTRFVLWNMAWQAIQERPILGWGPENFSYVSLNFYNPCLGSKACGEGKWSDRAHNIFLETLVGSGILGLLAYLGVFAMAVRSVWRRRFLEPSQEAISITLLCLLAAYLIQNQTGFDSVVSLLFWVITLAFINWRTDEKNQALLTPIPKSNLNPSRRAFVLPVFATLFLPVGLLYFVAQPTIGFQSLSSSVQSQTIQTRLQAYERAINVSQAGLPYRRSYMAYETSSKFWYASRQNVGGEYAAVKAEIKMAKDALMDTINRTPNYLRASLMLARIYQVESRLIRSSALEDAQTVLEKAIALNLNNPLPRWALASVLIERGKHEEAFTQTQEAFDLNPDDPKAHLARLVTAKFTLDESLQQLLFQESVAQMPDLTDDLQAIISMNPDAQLLAALDSFY